MVDRVSSEGISTTGRPARPSWTGYHWLALLACLAIFCTSAGVARYLFEVVPHLEDEVANLFQAQVFGQGKAYVDEPAQPNCFFYPFVIDHQETYDRFSHEVSILIGENTSA